MLDIVDIDKDIGNPQMCASYVVELYSNLMASEVCYCVLVKKEMILYSASIFFLLYFRCLIEHGRTPFLDIFDFFLAHCYLFEGFMLNLYVYVIPQLMRRPSPNYMEGLQRDITKCMRGILIDWLVEVVIPIILF